MERNKKLTAPLSREQNQDHFVFIMKKLRYLNLSNVTSFLCYSTCLLMVFSFYLFYPGIFIRYKSSSEEHGQTQCIVRPENNRGDCDLFKGQWIRDERGSLYSNYSCTTMQMYKNCFLHGRQDRDFLNWRWKPDQCELPRFNPEEFLTIVRGKTMSFIGDSLARNQMDSLLCLLSTAETPTQIFKDDEDRFTTWKFQEHDFTLKVLWTTFLVSATERISNGSNTGTFNLQLDKIDTSWSKELPSLDYAIISNGHWFFRPNYIYEDGNLLGCTYCGVPNVTELGPGVSIAKALRTALKEINNCKNCTNLHTLVRTFSPAHFEGGPWNDGGRCNGTRPYTKEEVVYWGDLEYRKLQAEEFGIAKNEGGENGNMFEVLDVTEMMIMRADAHPNDHYGKYGMNGYNDCIHWCLPGPVDTWNELLLEILKRSSD